MFYATVHCSQTVSIKQWNVHAILIHIHFDIGPQHGVVLKSHAHMYTEAVALQPYVTFNKKIIKT